MIDPTFMKFLDSFLESMEEFIHSYLEKLISTGYQAREITMKKYWISDTKNP